MINRSRTLLALFLICGFASCDSAHKKHQSTVTLQLNRPPFANSDPAFIEDQVAALSKSHPSFVIRKIEDSDLITITAQHTSNNQAQQLIEFALESYATRRSQEDLSDINERIQALKNEILAQRKVIEEAQEFADANIVAVGIPDFRNAPYVEVTEEEKLRRFQQRLTDFRSQRDQIKIEFQRLSTLKGDDLVLFAAGLDLPENQVTYYYTQYREVLNQRLLKLARGHAANHPEVIALDEKAADLLVTARLEATNLQENLKTKLEIYERQIERMAQMIDDRNSGRDDERNAELHQRFNTHMEAQKELREAQATLKQFQFEQENLARFLKKPEPPVSLLGWDHR